MSSRHCVTHHACDCRLEALTKQEDEIVRLRGEIEWLRDHTEAQADHVDALMLCLTGIKQALSGACKDCELKSAITKAIAPQEDVFTIWGFLSESKEEEIARLQAALEKALVERDVAERALLAYWTPTGLREKDLPEVAAAVGAIEKRKQEFSQ